MQGRKKLCIRLITTVLFICISVLSHIIISLNAFVCSGKRRIVPDISGLDIKNNIQRTAGADENLLPIFSVLIFIYAKLQSTILF